MGKRKSKTARPLVAHAGKDQIVYAGYNGTASVTLNGSGSSGSKPNKLTYTWYLDGSPVAMGKRPTIKLISGEHTITLVVSNTREDSEPSQVVITVIDPMEVECKIFPPSKDLFKKIPEIMARLYLPPGMTTDQINPEQPLRVYPGGAEVMHHYAIKWRRQKKTCSNIFAFFNQDVLKRVTLDGIAELAVSGQLKTGQYFYGRDTIRIEGQNMKKTSRRKRSLTR